MCDFNDFNEFLGFQDAMKKRQNDLDESFEDTDLFENTSDNEQPTINDFNIGNMDLFKKD